MSSPQRGGLFALCNLVKKIGEMCVCVAARFQQPVLLHRMSFPDELCFKENGVLFFYLYT